MTQFKFIAVILLCSTALHSAEIGSEFIRPLWYPKFSLSGDYSLARHFLSFSDPAVHLGVDDRFSTMLSFEAGIYQYMNAGGFIGNSFSNNDAGEPMDLRFGLFAKPFIPIGDRVAFFGRLSGGLAVGLFGNAKNYYSRYDKKDSFKESYRHQNYASWPLGGMGEATVGIEVFPFSRFGIVFESGIRVSAFYTGRKGPTGNEPKAMHNAPASFNFLLYEIPVSLMIHVIL